MEIHDIVESLGLRVLAGSGSLDQQVEGCYVADLLSCVMAGAEMGNLWITLQTHANIVAVAALLGLPAIIVAEGAPVPEDTLQKAEQQKVVMLSSSEPVYPTVARLVALGL